MICDDFECFVVFYMLCEVFEWFVVFKMLCDVFEWCLVFCDDLNGMARCVHVVMICLRL